MDDKMEIEMRKWRDAFRACVELARKCEESRSGAECRQGMQRILVLGESLGVFG